VLEAAPGETVLDALLRNGIRAPHSCRKGTCGSCLLRATGGHAPAPAAQAGLRETLRVRGYFHACQCVPAGDMEVALPNDAQASCAAVVAAKEFPGPEVCRLKLELLAPFDYRAGQNVILRRDDGLARSYSLASVPHADVHAELHVRRRKNGAMSRWIFESLEAGQRIELQGPFGDCFYLSGREDTPLLLIGTGTGLAPLIGIARDALLRGHRSRIVLYHGVRYPADAYGRLELGRLAAAFPTFEPVLCLSQPPAPEEFASGHANDLAFAQFEDLTGWRVYLCGSPGMVADAKKAAFLAGASIADIYTDAFEGNIVADASQHSP
jgi:NAD(P)H-flavin reductase/ferredoxin